MHSTSVNTSRITINTAGVYYVTFGYIVSFSGTITKEETVIKKNGSDIQYQQKYGSATGTISSIATALVSLSVADYLEVTVTMTGGTSPVTHVNADSTSFSAFFVGATS